MVIRFKLNNKELVYTGDGEQDLLHYLRLEQGITSIKDGCSGEGTCGACTVEIDGKAKLSCRTKLKSLEGKNVITPDGLSTRFRDTFSKSFAAKGAVQCGFCSPGFIMRSKVLYDQNPEATREEITKAINANLCRCTGYVKIIDSIEYAFEHLRENKSVEMADIPATIGSRYPKYQAVETAIGDRPFADDMTVEGMLYGALKFSDYPRAKVLRIDYGDAEKVEGVIRIFTARDIPGDRMIGLIEQDWPLMVDEGEVTHCISDVLVGIVARTEAIARQAIELIRVEYEVLPALTDMHEAVKSNAIRVHAGRSNVLEVSSIKVGDVEKALNGAKYVVSGEFTTQRIEHAFLETETAIALPQNGGVKLYSQGQGIYVDQKQVAKILNLPLEDVEVVQVQNGGGFGGKEDMTVQGHVSLFAYLLQKPVKLHFTRQESLRMHPKRHPVWMKMTLAADENGMLVALKLDSIGDTGAYASVGTKVMERVIGHASGGYYIPNTDLIATTVYTNNIPNGAMRGFGVPQVVFAVESLLDEICHQGKFDRWKIRYDNALENGSKTATGQVLETGVGLKETLLAVKDQFYAAQYAGLATGIKNTGVGNGMIDDSEVKITILAADRLLIEHGWTEMGQGVHTMAIQTLVEETGLPAKIMEVKTETGSGLPTGMTTSSRATALVANAIIQAARLLKNDLQNNSLEALQGRVYRGKFAFTDSTKPGDEVEKPLIHFSYGYATQLVILDDQGEIQKVVAAHDAGKVMNQMLFEGQIEGAVHMGLGYALKEDFPLIDGQPQSWKFRDIGILRAKEMPEVEVIAVESADAVGPYGAKGIGEIGLVPTAAAVANAFRSFNGKMESRLPLRRK
jgi:selenium-dependent xanthine dehydrogenase